MVWSQVQQVQHRLTQLQEQVKELLDWALDLGSVIKGEWHQVMSYSRVVLCWGADSIYKKQPAICHVTKSVLCWSNGNLGINKVPRATSVKKAKHERCVVGMSIQWTYSGWPVFGVVLHSWCCYSVSLVPHVRVFSVSDCPISASMILGLSTLGRPCRLCCPLKQLTHFKGWAHHAPKHSEAIGRMVCHDLSLVTSDSTSWELISHCQEV